MNSGNLYKEDGQGSGGKFLLLPCSHYPVYWSLLSAFAEDHGLCPRMDADSAVRSFVCLWANATADSATGGYPAEALGLRTGRFHRRWAQAGISWRYYGLCPWGSIG